MRLIVAISIGMILGTQVSAFIMEPKFALTIVPSTVVFGGALTVIYGLLPKETK